MFLQYLHLTLVFAIRALCCTSSILQPTTPTTTTAAPTTTTTVATTTTTPIVILNDPLPFGVRPTETPRDAVRRIEAPRDGRTVRPTDDRDNRVNIIREPRRQGQDARNQADYPSDCADVQLYTSAAESGVYTIWPVGCWWRRCSVNVTCDLMTDGGGWTVIQQRVDDAVDFDRSWREYKHGFGNDRNFWLGNEPLYALTGAQLRPTTLLIQLTDERQTSSFALYDDFLIDSELFDYRISLGTLFSSFAVDNLAVSRGQSFVTSDRQADSSRCFNERLSLGGWWYRNPVAKDCNNQLSRQHLVAGNLNLPYESLTWLTDDGIVGIQRSQMKLRPSNFKPAVAFSLRVQQ